MRNYHSILSIGFFVLLIGSYAVMGASTASPFPTINASINKPVSVLDTYTETLNDEFYVMSVTTGTGSQINPPDPALAQLYLLSPLRWLDNGDYQLVFSVMDANANGRNASFLFKVNGTGQRITMVEPAGAGTNNPNASIVIESELPSVCRWAYSNLPITSNSSFAAMKPFTNPINQIARQHTLTNAYTAFGVTPAENQVVRLSVTCSDGSHLSARVFDLTFLTFEPTLFVSSQPNPITDPSSPHGTITIRSDQEIWCTIDDVPLRSSKNANSYAASVSASISGNPASNATSQILNIMCENRAGLHSTTTYTQLYDYSEPIAITLLSPLASLGTTYQLRFETSKYAACTATHGTSAVSLSTTDNRLFTASRTLNDGANLITVSCQGQFQPNPTVAKFNIVADAKKPNLNVTMKPPLSCGLSAVTFQLNGTDPLPGSGIANYTYSIVDKQNVVVVPSTTTAATEITEKNLALRNGTDYSIIANATDNAGYVSDTRTLLFRASGENEPACDAEDPITLLKKQQIPTGVNATVLCSDGKLPCADTYFLTLIAPSATCPSTFSSANQYSLKNSSGHAITTPSKVCWSVSDLSGRTAKGEEFVNLSARNASDAALCSDGVKGNGETDVDCGGLICEPLGKTCALGKTCSTNMNCASGLCSAGICTISTCTDGLKGGNETGVDCGGSCAACSGTAACVLDADCSIGLSCRRGACLDPADLPDVETPGTIDDPGYIDAPSGGGFLRWLLIGLGIVLILGGLGFVVAYQPGSTYQPPSAPPVTLWSDEPPPSVERDRAARAERQEAQTTSTTARAARERPRGERTATRVSRLINTFSSPEDLTSKETVTHEDIETAYKSFDMDTFKDVTKQLLDDNKVEKQHVAVALTDLAASGEEHDDIAALREEFGITPDEKPKKKRDAP